MAVSVPDRLYACRIPKKGNLSFEPGVPPHSHTAMGSTQSKPAQHVSVDNIDEKRDQLVPAPVNCATAPVSADGSLSLESVSNWEATAAASAKTRLARAVLSHSNLSNALVRRQAFVADVHVFNTELDFKTGPITNQASSGRCWLFATTNVLRYEIMKKLNLKEFQLSQVCLLHGHYYLHNTDNAVVVPIFLGQTQQSKLLSRTVNSGS